MDVQAFIAAAARTPFGRLEGSSALSLMQQVSCDALAGAGLEARDIDGLLVGYAISHPHVMLADVLAESLGAQPSYAHALAAGGATGAALLQLAALLVQSRTCERVLIAAGDVRLSGAPRSAVDGALADVGQPDWEAPLGLKVPDYYALLASRYLAETDAEGRDLAELAVLMRRHAQGTPGAQFSTPIDVDDVLAARPIAPPLTLLSCCPVSDGACALIVSSVPGPQGAAVRVAGAGQAHRHQHLSVLDWGNNGAGEAARRAFSAAGVAREDIGALLVYDSFTITLALLLEGIGFSAPGAAGRDAADGCYGRDGKHPLNPHGGLLSYGHSGVAGGMAHLVEAYLQASGLAAERAVDSGRYLYAHGDGGVMSAHVGIVLEQLG